MAVGQGGLWAAGDVAVLDALETDLQVQEAERGARHVRTLRTLLALDGVYAGRGLGFSTVPHAALALGCSEHRANVLLTDARGLVELPGAAHMTPHTHPEDVATILGDALLQGRSGRTG